MKLLRGREALWIGALILIIALGIALRLSVHFREYLIPSCDGGYYPVQVRSLITTGKLEYPALPLTFFIQAGFAELLYLLGLGPLEECIIIGIKLEDSIIPALSAIPVYLLVDRWRKEAYKIVPLTCAALTAFSPMLLRFLGDLEKNGLGVFFLLWFLYFMYRYLETGLRKDLILSMFFLASTGLTHVLCLGVALAYLILCLLTSLILTREAALRALTLTVMVFALLGAVVGATWIVKPEFLGSFEKLAVCPCELFATEIPWEFFHLSEVLFWSPIFFWILFAAGLAAVAMRRLKNNLEAAFTLSSSIIGLFLAYPFISEEWLWRLLLMSFIPFTLIIGSLLRFKNTILLLAVCALLLCYVVPQNIEMSSRIVTEIPPDGYEDLVSMKNYIPEGSSVILTHHCLEYWACWATGVHAQTLYDQIDPSYWERYDHVLLIMEKYCPPPEPPPPTPGPGKEKPPEEGGGQPPPPPPEPWIPPPNAITLFEGRMFILVELEGPIP
ncbi:MAG: hypothetical protein DRJ98_07515 [Thermoprotei archaeon]|nr:MAG: hypothetical protein DRJ98_07515 [Thermoprotei archaeon]